jgi:hypothetical protein
MLFASVCCECHFTTTFVVLRELPLRMSRLSVQFCYGMQEVSAYEVSETTSACVIVSVVSVESDILRYFLPVLS